MPCESSDRRRRDKGGANKELQPHRPDEGDQEVTGRQRQGGGGPDQDRARDAGAGAVRPGARSHADEHRQREDGQREQQPAKQADGCEGCEYCEDDHGGGLREKWSDGRASTTTTAHSNYS
jgi:hypothetical protein